MIPPSVGAQLRQARAQLQVTLKDVTQQTKIQPWVLEALEEDRLQTAMSPVYVKSFLATYAKLLRLDAATLIAQLFPAAVEEPGRESQPVFLAEHPAASSAIGSSGPRIDLAGFWGLLRRLVPLAVGVAALAGVLALNPVRWLTARIPMKLASFTVTPRPPAPREALLHLEPNHPLELSITAHRETWVSVVADGRLVAQQPLHAGDQETWQARRRFELIVGTPSRVEIFLNGQAITPFAMAHQGRLTITHQRIRPLEERTSPATHTAQSPADAQ